MPRPTFTTKSHEIPGKDFSVNCGIQNIESHAVATVITTTVAVSSSLTNGGVSTRGRKRTLTKKKEEEEEEKPSNNISSTGKFLASLSYSAPA